MRGASKVDGRSTVPTTVVDIASTLRPDRGTLHLHRLPTMGTAELWTSPNLARPETAPIRAAGAQSA